MATTTKYKSYDQGEVESIRLMLEAEAKEAKPLCYEVKVNGNTRIHKTNNVDRFNELYNFINENTTELIINIYPDANNNKKEWYKYKFSDAPENLNGVSDMEQKFNERMKAFEDKQSAKRIEEKLKETEDELKQAEDYIAILEGKLEEQKIKPNHFGNWDLGKLGSSVIEGIAEHHPKVFEKVPVLNGIAKVIQDDLKSRPQQLGSFEGDVSFKAKEQKTERSPEAEAQERAVRNLANFIGEHFDEQQRKMLGWVIVELGENPAKLQTVSELLDIDPKERMAEEEQPEETN